MHVFHAVGHGTVFSFLTSVPKPSLNWSRIGPHFKYKAKFRETVNTTLKKNSKSKRKSCQTKLKQLVTTYTNYLHKWNHFCRCAKRLCTVVQSTTSADSWIKEVTSGFVFARMDHTRGRGQRSGRRFIEEDGFRWRSTRSNPVNV